MTSRGGETTKKGQKYQNVFAFKHNKNSILTRKIRETPLDHLCKRCLEQLEWRIFYRKYKPLSSAGKCNKCEGKTVYKAYRTICDRCSVDNKLCSKCALPTDGFAKPTNRRNDPNAGKKHSDELDEIMKTLKVRYIRTVQRRWREGEYLIFDKEKGIINEYTGEVVVNIEIVKGNYEFEEPEDEEEKENENEDNNFNQEDFDSDEKSEDENEINIKNK